MMEFPDSCRKSVFLDESLGVHFPVFVSFPEFKTMDYIDRIYEKDPLTPHLQEIIGSWLPYDKENILTYIISKYT